MHFFIKKQKIDLSIPIIMGILNVTPDSFSDGNDYYKNIPAAIDHVSNMINAGITFVDIGGESTRPGSKSISSEEEMERVIPVITALIKRFNIFISINTSKAKVIEESASIGVHLINDNRSLEEEGALKAAAKSKLPICLMHMQGTPYTMQHQPSYKNLLKEISIYFEKKIDFCKTAGITKDKLLIDPGFGFGKNFSHNYKILANLSHFKYFNLPLLVGISRKSMIGKLINSIPKNRVIGSVTCAVIAIMQGANIIRVHDFKETAEAVCIIKSVLKNQ